MKQQTDRRLAGALFAILLLSAPAAPACAGETGSFLDCGPIESDAERLACYDRVYESRLQAEAAGEIPAAAEAVEKASEKPEVSHDTAPLEPAPVPEEASAPEAVEQARSEAAFGFPRSTYPDELKVLRSMVIRYGQDTRTRVLFYLENGQVWLQTESRRFVTPDEPLLAEITPGMMGAFYLTLEGKKQRVKVKRIR